MVQFTIASELSSVDASVVHDGSSLAEANLSSANLADATSRGSAQGLDKACVTDAKLPWCLTLKPYWKVAV
jgi:hypothetical protein